jgi:hypothetical protein
LYQFYCRDDLSIPFGTIIRMTFQENIGRKVILGILTVLLIASCASPTEPPASSTDPTPASVFSDNIPTPTPFQPQLEDSPDPYLAVTTPQPAPTYTPYPTKYVIAQGGSAVVELAPSVDNNVISNNPLTGLPVSDPSLLERRPLAVKIGNSPDYVRPQSGLSLADVVYEYYIEWGDTRFVAVFYSNDAERAGPVRSGRFLDEHIARMYHSFLFFKGADPREMDHFRSIDISDFLIVAGIGNCPPFFMGPYRRDAYNNVFFNTTKWSACAERRGLDNSPQTISGGFFSTVPPESALSISRIYSFYSIYNYNYWEYDPAASNYVRYQEARDLLRGASEAYAPLTDDLTKLPITAENMVVLLVPHIYANTYNAEDEVFHIDLIDYGNAYVFRDGIALPARWNRTERDQPLLLTTLDGEPIYLRPGRTFFQVMGTTSSYQLNGSEWRFVFQTP